MSFVFIECLEPRRLLATFAIDSQYVMNGDPYTEGGGHSGAPYIRQLSGTTADGGFESAWETPSPDNNLPLEMISPRGNHEAEVNLSGLGDHDAVIANVSVVVSVDEVAEQGWEISLNATRYTIMVSSLPGAVIGEPYFALGVSLVPDEYVAIGQKMTRRIGQFEFEVPDLGAAARLKVVGIGFDDFDGVWADYWIPKFLDIQTLDEQRRGLRDIPQLGHRGPYFSSISLFAGSDLEDSPDALLP
ncbi:MAG: hypothetical protein AAGD32_12245 [Planctomycetota bacterium]